MSTLPVTRPAVAPVGDDRAELERLLVGRAVRTAFQPIVDLASGEVLAYEALSRGPAGGVRERPDGLFEVAADAGRTAELDELCRDSALSQALASGLRAPLALFVNVEPGALDVHRLARPGGVLARAQEDLRVVMEVTERDLTARPAELLAVVERVRALGWAVALDDVGADPRSLALMPFLAPEIIKLDLALVQQQPGLAAAEIIAAVRAEAERSGSIVLAEGIETEEHAELARGMGAQLGQGWLFGRPGPLSIAPVLPASPLQLPPRTAATTRRESVFDLAASTSEVQRVTKPLLVAISKHLERQAMALGTSAVVLGAFEDARYFTPDSKRRYTALAERISFVGAMGSGLSTQPAPGVRGAHLPADDPVVGEWDIAVLGPHFAAALVAKDLGDERGEAADDAHLGSAPESARRFDYVLTYERQAVAAIAAALMARMVAETAPVADEPPLAWDRPTTAPTIEPGDTDRAFARLVQGPAWEGLPVPREGGERRLADLVAGAVGGGAGLDSSVLHDAIAAATTGVVVADAREPDMPLVYVNPAFERLSGYRADEVVGRNCRFLQGPDTDPVVIAELRQRLRAGEAVTSTLVNYRKDGTRWANECVLSPVLDAGGRVTHYVGVQTDVTNRLAAQARIEHLATHDPMTGLPNRAMLLEELQTRIGQGLPTALLFADLDGFKQVNDTYGHVVGDEVLVEVSRRLRVAVRPQDLVGRHGGDEFLVLLRLDGLAADSPYDSEGATRSAAERILRGMSRPVQTAAGAVDVRVSIGASLFPEDADDVDVLLDHADEAMYCAKDEGTGLAVFGRVETVPSRWSALLDRFTARRRSTDG